MVLEVQIHCNFADQAALGQSFSPHPTSLPHLSWLGDSFTDGFRDKLPWITNATGLRCLFLVMPKPTLNLIEFPFGIEHTL